MMEMKRQDAVMDALPFVLFGFQLLLLGLVGILVWGLGMSRYGLCRLDESRDAKSCSGALRRLVGDS